MNPSNQDQNPATKTVQKSAAHEPDAETHQTLIRLVGQHFKATDYKLEKAGEKTPRDFYGMALLETGVGDTRKAYFKLDGRQRIPTIIVLNGQELAKWEIEPGQKYRVYVPGGQHSATLKKMD